MARLQAPIAAVVLATLFCAACGDLRDIDARTDRLVKERSSTLGPDSYPPRTREWIDPSDERDRRLLSKEPTTLNPPAADLRYQAQVPPFPSPGEEAAAVDDRLAATTESLEEGATPLDLRAALRQCQQTSREYLSAEEQYIVAAIRLLAERHLWGPRLFNDTSAGFTGSQTDGDTSSVATVINELRATQRLPAGGEAAVRWVWNATENLRSAATGQYVQSSRLVLDASIPLLRGAGDVAQESLIQQERNLVYAAREFESFRRAFLVDIAKEYFALVQQRQAIENSLKQLEAIRREEARKQALYDAGRVAQTEVNIARSQVLSTANTVATQRESYVLALDRFKIRLGLPPDQRISLVAEVPEDMKIPLPDTSPTLAVENALRYRLDLQNRRDQLDDSLRGVKNARNALLPDLTLAGGVTFPTDASAREGGVVYEPDDVAYTATIAFSAPLDRETERLGLRQAIIQYGQAKRDFEQFRDRLIIDVRSQARTIDRALYSLRLAEEGVVTNERRKLEQSLKPAEVTSQQILETENALLDARNARDQAVTDLRNAVLDYLVQTGLMRVGRDGSIIRLPGMDGGTPGAALPAEPPPPGDAAGSPDPTP